MVFRYQKTSELSCQGGWYRLIEENPQMSARPRARPFYNCRNPLAVTDSFQGFYVLKPPFFVEINGEKTTGFVGQHWIYANHVLSQNMRANRSFIEGVEFSVGAFGAFDHRLSAQCADPFVRAGRTISPFAGAFACPEPGVHIFPSAKVAHEQGYFVLMGQLFCKRWQGYLSPANR